MNVIAGERWKMVPKVVYQYFRGYYGKTPAPVTYIVLWTPQELAGDTAPRSLAAFSGPTPPTGTDSPGLCGTFRYEAGPAAR